MSRALQASQPRMLVVPEHAGRRETAGCPTCGHALTIRTDGLTGQVRSECAQCLRTASAQRNREALRFLARQYGLEPEEAARRLAGRRRKPSRAAPAYPRQGICARCHEAFTLHGPPRLAEPHCRLCRYLRSRDRRGMTIRSHRRYREKRCACGTTFTPTGPRGIRCTTCRRSARYRSAHRSHA